MAWLIYYIALFTWLLPPFKQRKGEYFYYFLIIAYAESTSYLLLKLLHLHLDYFYFCFSIVLLRSLYNIIKINKYILDILLIAVFIITLFVPLDYVKIFIAIIHLIILLLFIIRFTEYLVTNQRILLFHTALILYESSIIFKFIFRVFMPVTGIDYFYITSAFEILFAFYFLFDTAESSKLFINLKNKL